MRSLADLRTRLCSPQPQALFTSTSVLPAAAQLSDAAVAGLVQHSMDNPTLPMPVAAAEAVLGEGVSLEVQAVLLPAAQLPDAAVAGLGSGGLELGGVGGSGSGTGGGGGGGVGGGGPTTMDTGAHQVPLEPAMWRRSCMAASDAMQPAVVSTMNTVAERRLPLHPCRI